MKPLRLERAWSAVEPLRLERCECTETWVKNGWECWHRKPVTLLDEDEALTAASTTILRLAISGDFILGFQGSLSADQMKQHISAKLSVTADRIILWTKVAILEGNYGERPWDFEKLMQLSQVPVGSTLAQQTTFDIYVAIREDVQQKTPEWKGQLRRLTFTCDTCGTRPWYYTDDQSPRCHCRGKYYC